MALELKKEYDNLKESEKVEFLIQIEFKEHVDKWSLINNIISNEKDYDLARVQALKILEIAKIPTPEKTELAKSLLHIIIYDEDYDVKNYATVAFKNFMDFFEIEQLAKKIVLNKTEDIDIRYNAFAAILKIGNIENKKQLLTQLIKDKVFNKSALRNLSNMS